MRKESLDEQLAAFINDEMGGDYSLDDVASRFGISLSSDQYASSLRKLIDQGVVPMYRS